MSDKTRIIYPPPWAARSLFDEVTSEALHYEEGASVHREDYHPEFNQLFGLLADLTYRGIEQERIGATYRSLSLIGRRAGFGDGLRRRFVREAEWVGLTQRHAAHIIARLDDPGMNEEVRELTPMAKK